jgi:nitrogen fixation NifU-like protein
VATRPSARVLDHLASPRNAGSWPRDTPGVQTGESGDEASGRLVRIQVRIAPDGRIAEARFKAFGCPFTIACASFTAARVAGCTRAEAAALSAAEVAAGLELGADRAQAPELALAALRAALDPGPG